MLSAGACAGQYPREEAGARVPEVASEDGGDKLGHPAFSRHELGKVILEVGER